MRRALSSIGAVAVFVIAFTAGVECKRIFSSSRHGYPSPSSHAGLSGHGTGAPSGRYGPHGTPVGGGGHSYPHSSSGLSGNNRPGSQPHSSVYNPPQQIHYSPANGASPSHPYPVYHGPPPVYINQIHDSGSKFSTLLAGLALYNLGRSASGIGGHSSSSQDKDNGESCALRIIQDMNVERVKIPCYIVSTFTDAHDVKTALGNKTASTTPVPTTTTAAPTTLPTQPVITIPPPSQSVQNTTSANKTLDATVSNSTGSEKVSSGEVMNNTTNATATVVPTVANDTNVPPTNATITNDTTNAPINTNITTPEPVDALKVKGDPIEIKKDARCFVERKTKTSSSTKEIECGLLQQYALQSLQKPQPRPSSAVSVSLMSQVCVCTLSVFVFLVQ